MLAFATCFSWRCLKGSLLILCHPHPTAAGGLESAVVILGRGGIRGDLRLDHDENDLRQLGQTSGTPHAEFLRRDAFCTLFYGTEFMK
jgi:hypothetical protein